MPAYFDESQRRATRDAAELAGLKAERIINEPTAAAMAYGLHERSREFTAVVLDLGGGTFDVTVMDVIEGVIEIRASSGDTRLGGEDFVQLLVNHVLAQTDLNAARLPANSLGRVRQACEAAKCRLSSAPETHVVLPALSMGNTQLEGAGEVDVVITRAQAEALWAPLLVRLRDPIWKALRDADQAPESVDEILLVGGATRMPCVMDLAAQLFGKMPSRHLPADEAVAMGAAVQAALKARDASVEDMVVTDIAPFTMGIAVCSRLYAGMVDDVYLPVLERGTVIPATRVKTVSTASDRQTAIEVVVYQGEHSMCHDNKRLGSFKVDGLPPRPAGELSVDVRFTYDINGLLEVEALVLETKQRKSILLENAPGRMTPAQIAEARKAFEKLKFHPRDDLPNVTALQRAESLYVELTGLEREAVGQLITRFRAILNGQDPAAIQAGREELMALLDFLARNTTQRMSN